VEYNSPNIIKMARKVCFSFIKKPAFMFYIVNAGLSGIVGLAWGGDAVTATLCEVRAFCRIFFL
jgi:hypothetical protein